MKHILIGVLILLLSPVGVYGFDVKVTGVSLHVEYMEPEVNADESVLVDLEYTTVKWESVAFSGYTSFPASSVGGGGLVEAEIDLPVLEGQEVVLDFWITATDDNGNEGVDSEHVVKEVDRLAPGPPK